MEANILDKKEEALFERTRVTAEILGTATPSRTEALKALAHALKAAKEELISIESIGQQYGSRTARVTAFVYKSAEAKAKFDAPHLAKRTKTV